MRSSSARAATAASAGLLGGSVTHRLLHIAPSPALVIPSHGAHAAAAAA